ncbi:inner membrane protein [Inhella inkyongensis]|uniref:Inner membrane protein n=1 Tax=Inhella inkyongensis TaxID=392593 RepID=A0A840S9R5_9BURK|nr:cell envelope integrity protein CreD [Inhella inkyongensis]MBB5205251.1 inner membrane protein [Inhella inkyongensis]
MRGKLWLGKGLGLLAVGIMVAAALAKVGGLIDQRLGFQDEARQSVRQALASEQTVLGPLLQRHCTEHWELVEEDTEKGKVRRTPQESSFVLSALPAKLEVDGELLPEPRYRGLFKVNTYQARLKLKAQWPHAKELLAQAQRGGQLRCGVPRLVLAVGDARGIRSVELQLNGQAQTAAPGSGHPGLSQGLHAELPQLDLQASQQLAMSLDLVGTEQFAWVPAAGDLRLNLHSSWPHASYGGRFLPVRREADAKGFTAEWRVSALATRAGADVRAGKMDTDALSVALIDPVNPLMLSERAIKYALLFVALVFAAVATTELLGRVRVHPVQYLLVGLAQSLFFLLLLALSEHLPFVQAYALATAAASALLAGYAASLFGRWRAGAAFGAGVALLFGALYYVLNLEQTALLMGSLLMFVVLAALMFATRRIDWYAMTQEAWGAEKSVAP